MISNTKGQTIKVLSDSYLYGKADYTREIFDYLMSSDIIDKQSDAFSDILYQVKVRQVSPVLLKVLNSNKVILTIGKKAMPRPFKVFRASNVKESKDKQDKKVFIDCTDLIKMDGGVYKCKNIAVLLSYLISAMTYVLYHEMGDKVIRNSTLVQTGSEAFVDMMLYILGYLKVPVTYADNKEKMGYTLAMYYQRCILCKDDMTAISQMSKKVSKLDPKKCEYLDMIFYPFYDGKKFVDINEFIIEFARIFLNQNPGTKDSDRLNVDVLVQRWMYAFGPGTYLGLELFPPFASILTDCYVGAFVNQQNTIEKIVGPNVAEFTNTLLNLGSDNA